MGKTLRILGLVVRSSKAATKLISLAFLGVLGALAVNELSRINRQDAKNAKKSAKKNSFRAAKNFYLRGG